MAKRGPALYELIGDRPLGRSSSPPPRAPDRTDPSTRERSREAVEPKAGPTRQRPAPAETPARTEPAASAQAEPASPVGAMFQPGHVLRVPVGYVWFAAAVLIVAAISAYFVGYQVAAGRAEAERRADLADRQPPLGDIDDPLNTPGAVDADGRSTTPRSIAGGSRDADRRSPAPDRQQDRRRPAPAPAGSITGSPLPNVYFVSEAVPDPRVEGLNYLVLASGITRDDAERLALFLGRNGVGAVRTRPNSRNLVTVATLEGLNAEGYGSPARQAVESRIRALGRQFREQGGWTDFTDAWWDRLD